MHRATATLVLLYLCAVVRADALEWKTHTQHARTTPFQSSIAIVFDFKNNGTTPVAILGIQTNCDCLDATTDHKVYAPGEVGHLTARFTVGDRLGLYQRSITILSDDEPHTPTHLAVNIDVPEIAALSQRILGWKIGSQPVEKTVIIRPTPGLSLDFHTAQPTNDDFIVQLQTIKTGAVYRLSVKPRSTKHAANAAIRMSGRDNAGHEVLVSAYANVE